MADFRTATPTAGVSCATSGEIFVLSYITPAGRPHYLKKIKVGARSIAASDLPMVVRIIQADTDGTATTVAGTPSAVDELVSASLPTGKHTYTVAPTVNIRTLWQGTVWPQSAAEFSLIDAQTGLGLKVSAGKVCAIGITAATTAQTVDAELNASD